MGEVISRENTISIDEFDELFAAANLKPKIDYESIPSTREEITSNLTAYFGEEVSEMPLSEQKLLLFDLTVFLKNKRRSNKLNRIRETTQDTEDVPAPETAAIAPQRTPSAAKSSYLPADHEDGLTLAKSLSEPASSMVLSLALAFEGEEAWQRDARCLDADPEIFFPEKGGSTKEAKRICGLCPSKEACLAYALENEERFGIWGGLSENERRRLKRAPESQVA